MAGRFVMRGLKPGSTMTAPRAVTILALVAGLSLIGSPARARTGEFQPSLGFGAGPIVATATSPHRAFDGAGGIGLQLSFEKYFGQRTAWDLRLGGFYTGLEAPEEIYYPADDGDWSILSTGLRYVVADTRSVDGWVAVEASLHYAQMEEFAYGGTGWGLGPALGADFPLGEGKFLLRLGAHFSWVDLDADSAPSSGASFVALVGLDFVFRLRRPDSGPHLSSRSPAPRS